MKPAEFAAWRDALADLDDDEDQWLVELAIRAMTADVDAAECAVVPDIRHTVKVVTWSLCATVVVCVVLVKFF